KWGGDGGKLLLTLFRIAAVYFFSYWLWSLVKKNAHWGLIISVAMIIAGAMGNIFDSVFYGVIFSESHPGGPIATLFPQGGGYGSWLHGRVVDMLYFPLMEGTFPQWVPLWGGEYFVFFRPIFNVADFSISTGVIAILIFQKQFFKKEETTEIQMTEPATENNSANIQPPEQHE
ncbi:MAG: lipoprotein signal peptidase, partial [Sphingobacteriales bacterium]